MAENVNLAKPANQQVDFGGSVLSPEERVRFAQMEPYQITLGMWLPNPGNATGALTFKKSNTQTPYERFSASFVHPDTNQPVRCIVALNQNAVLAHAVEPTLLTGETVYVNMIDFMISLRKQRINGPATVIVLTNFQIIPSQEIKDTKIKVKTDIAIRTIEKQQEIATESKNKYLRALGLNLVTSPLDAAQVTSTVNSSVGNEPTTGGIDPNNPAGNVNQTTRGAGNSTQVGQGTPQTKNTTAEAMEEARAAGMTQGQTNPQAQGVNQGSESDEAIAHSAEAEL